MTLSAIRAIQKGREIVPQYVSAELVTLHTHKGLNVWYDSEAGWMRNYQPGEEHKDDPDREYGVPLPDSFIPQVGAACLLGAQGVAMGVDLEELQQNDAFYVHPDFIEPEEERELWPDGYVYSSGDRQTDIAKAVSPCACATSHSPVWTGSRPIPEIIAHLNDTHDPRANIYMYDRNPDKWTEERIIEWLRSLGYNGDHKA